MKPLFESNKEAAAASAEDAEQAKTDAAPATEVEGKKAVASEKVAPGYLFNDRIVPLAPYAIRGGDQTGIGEWDGKQETAELAGPYADPAQQEIPFPTSSYSRVPWRAYMDTWPASRFANGGRRGMG